MNVLKSLLLAASVGLLGAQAHAWTATARGESYTHTNYNSSTPQEAETEALGGCNAKSSDCRLIGLTMNGTAVVLAQGDRGWGRATNLNPILAAKKALQQCREVSKNCRLSTAVWDSGATRAAVAQGSDKIFTFTNAETQAEAELEALKGCEKNITKVGSCKVLSDFSTNQHAFYSYAVSASFTGLAQRDSKNEASHGAMEICEKGKAPGETCAITTVFENRGPKAEPASMKQVVAEIEQAKRKVSSAPSVRTVQTTQLSCTNQCLNGSCLRTFSDGRKDRWQAPHVFDPFKNAWTWDLTTNACGS